MNIKKIMCLLMLVTLTSLLSCENTLYDDMVDDRVYIVNPGLNEITIGNTGSYTHGVYVVKSGVGKQEARVQLDVNQSLLDTYNEANGTNYQLLPDQYFDITIRDLVITQEGYREAFEIAFDADGIASLHEGVESTYALPCEMKPANPEISVDPERMITIIVPTIVTMEDGEGS